MQCVAFSELAYAPELNDSNMKCVTPSFFNLSATRTGTPKDPATLQSAHDRARALAVVAKILWKTGTRDPFERCGH